MVNLVRAVIGATLAVAFSCPARADFSGKVVAVTDGDTLTVLVDRRQVEFHLAEIDAPELKQAFGQQSLQNLTDLCLGKDAVVRETGRERNGRSIARVTCSGTDASAEQVRLGMAWVYQRYAQSTSPLYFLEDAAQRSHQGLWADKYPVRPWIWRRGQKDQSR
jgi:endonuclease YncB( thermonuclease family)